MDTLTDEGDTLTDLVQAMEENLVLRYTWPGQFVPALRVYRDRHLLLVDSGLPLASRNGVCRAGFEPQQSARWVDFVQGWFAQGSGHFTWWVGPSKHPDNLEQCLIEAGMVEGVSRKCVSARINFQQSFDPAPLWLEVRTVATPADLEAFASVLIATDPLLGPQLQHYFEAASAGLLSDRPVVQCQVGYLDGVPVACSELVCTGTLAVLYQVAVLEGHRGQGLGSAMIRNSLAAAVGRGAKVGVVSVTAEQERLFLQLGFTAFGSQVVYTCGTG